MSANISHPFTGNPFVLADYPFEGLVADHWQVDEHDLRIEYSHGSWWVIDTYEDEVVVEHRFDTIHRAVVVLFRRIRALS